MPIISDGNNQTGDELTDKHTTVGQVVHTGSYVLSGSTGSVLNVKEGLLFVTSSNRVGIGTEAPTSPLHVYANESSNFAALIDNDQNSAGHVMKLTTDGTGNGSYVLDMESASSTIFRARADGRFGFGPDGVSSMGAGTFVVGIDNSSHTADIAISQRLQHLGDSNTYLDFPSNDNITFSAGGSEELKIASDAILVKQYIKHDGDENTWINFSDNRIRLNAGGNNFIDCEDPGSAPHKVRINNGGNNIDFVIKDNSNNVYFTADASTSRVGIGTDTPGEKLHIAGGLKIDEGQITVSATEKVNKKAISLDGTNDHILVSDEDEFSFTNGSSDVAFSLSAWVYVGDVSSDDGPFIAKANFSTGNTEFIFKHSNGVLQFFLYDRDQSASGHQIRTLANSATLSDATWHHVVATYSGNGSHTGMKVYTDGSQTAATQSTLTGYTRVRNTSTPLTLGATEDLANANRVFEDRMADCVVFNKELSSSEVTELYNSGKVMNIRNHSAFSNVISWWKMGDDEDAGGSGGIRDYVSGHHGTLTNGAAIIDETGLSSDAMNSLATNVSGSLGIGIESPDETLHVYGKTKLEGPLILKERTYDPDNPAEGSSVIWMSNGHGSGDDGDIMIKVTAGGVTKTVTLVDFSAS